MAILRAFTADKPMLGNREICDLTGFSKATVSRLTYTLTLLGYLSPVSGLQKYRLAPGVLSLGHPFLAGLTIRQIIRPYMEALARDTGCTINLGMFDRTNVVFVETTRVDDTNIYLPDIGSTRPLLSTSIGRALLMMCDSAEREQLLNRIKLQDPAEFARLQPIWNADAKAFPMRGYCLSKGDWKKEIHAVGVPVRRPSREERMALNCTLTGSLAGESRLEKEIVPKLFRTVRAIELATGLL
ncbi:IclR family transcriptional regulator [Allopusillimonas ginsengisoli]|nr:IclR family transcriptional regulator [Allopusillimonas ginsengisoli]